MQCSYCKLCPPPPSIVFFLQYEKIAGSVYAVMGLNMKYILCTVAYWRVLSIAWHQMLWKMLLHKFSDLLEGWHDHMWPCWQAVSELLVHCQSTTWHFSYLLLLCHLACFASYPWKRISHTLPLHTWQWFYPGPRRSENRKYWVQKWSKGLIFRQ